MAKSQNMVTSQFIEVPVGPIPQLFFLLIQRRSDYDKGSVSCWDIVVFWLLVSFDSCLEERWEAGNRVVRGWWNPKPRRTNNQGIRCTTQCNHSSSIRTSWAHQSRNRDSIRTPSKTIPTWNLGGVCYSRNFHVDSFLEWMSSICGSVVGKWWNRIQKI